MSAGTYAARSTSCAHVKARILTLDFPAAGERYSQADAHGLFLGIQRVLKGTYNPRGAVDGMAALLRASDDATNPSELAAIKSTDVETVESVLAKSKADADRKNKAKKKDDPEVEPIVKSFSEAVDAADRANEHIQAVVGAKEGAAEAIVQLLGRQATDAILRTPEGAEMDIDDWELHQLITKMMQGAERQRHTDVLKSLGEKLAFQFDHRQTYNTNVANLRSALAQLKRCGVPVGEPIVATIILADVERAAEQPSWGREIANALDRIRGAFQAEHVHDAASIVTIMRELAHADATRSLRDAPAPDDEPGTANSIVEKLSTLFDSVEVDSEEGTAAASEGYTSDSSEESARTSRSRRSGGARERARSRRERHTAENNPCPHCKKWGRRVRHPNVPSSKCYWNKKYKGFRPRNVCRKMDIKYKSRSDFAPDMGGYPSDGEGSGE